MIAALKSVLFVAISKTGASMSGFNRFVRFGVLNRPIYCPKRPVWGLPLCPVRSTPSLEGWPTGHRTAAAGEF